MADTVQHQQRRQALVADVRKKGIDDESVLAALERLPRHFFMSPAQDEIAYVDKAFPIGEGQTISQPYTVAYQTELLQPRPHHKVLEVGTGSGYQAAVLAEMGADVFTIERQRKLFERNRDFGFLHSYRNIHFFYGDGYDGLPHYAPFDKVLLTAASSEVPPRLMTQLRTGGQMVLPYGESGGPQRMMRLTKKADGRWAEEWFDMFSFVPMLKGRQE